MYSTEKITITKCWSEMKYVTKFNPIYTTRTEFKSFVEFVSIPSGIRGYGPIRTARHSIRPELITNKTYEEVTTETKIMVFEDINGKIFFMDYIKELNDILELTLQKN